MWAHTPNFGWTPRHSGRKLAESLEQLGREHAVGDDPLVVVEVVDEQVERPQALDQPALDALHSSPSMTRGMTSNGQARSMFPPSEYTVNVMPIVRMSRSAARWRSRTSSSPSDGATR